MREKKRAKRIRGIGINVIVEDGNFEKALRMFKRKVDDANIVKEARDRREYVKPTTKRKLARNAAVKRWSKIANSHKLAPRKY
jgi:small subunit ribosomal protein S21